MQAARLRLVHGGVGVAQQGLRVAPGAGRRDPTAHGHRHLAAVQRERRPDRLGHPHPQQLDVGLGHPVADDDELVAPEPGQGVTRPDHGLQALRHQDQQLVAGGVPDAVVDHLELVDVEEQCRDRTGGPAGQGLGDPVGEQGTVGQRGERVVEGLVRELGLHLLPVGDVLDLAEEQRRLPLGPADERDRPATTGSCRWRCRRATNANGVPFMSVR